MSETLRGLPATTTLTALNADVLDEEVGSFPPAVRLPKANGVPLVYAFERALTGVLLVVAPSILPSRPSTTLVTGKVAGRGLLSVHRLADPWPNRLEMARALDDRWRIDLRTPIGFGFALRWLINQESAYEAETAPGGLGWPHYPKAVRHLLGRTTDKDRLALARAVEAALGPIGGEE